MKFDTLLKTQKRVVKLLQNSLKKNRLVHTYLFEGAKGTPKLDAAYYFASLILCSSDNKPCLECEDCRKILKEVHPSIFLIKPENGVIRKDQVDMLEKEFSLTSIDEGKRVYIIDEIDKATQSSANSLLKFLEEMNGENYGILITENLYNVLSTIRSRSQIVSFSKVPTKAVALELITKGVDEETSNILSTLTNSVDECLDLISEGKVLDIIELVKKIGTNIVTNQKPPALVFFEEGEVLFKETDKKYHNIFLELLISFSNDKLFYILNQTDNIVFRNTIELISDHLKQEYQVIVNEIEKLLEFKNRLKYNVNIELFYTNMLIEIVR